LSTLRLLPKTQPEIDLLHIIHTGPAGKLQCFTCCRFSGDPFSQQGVPISTALFRVWVSFGFSHASDTGVPGGDPFEHVSSARPTCDVRHALTTDTGSFVQENA